MKDPHAIFLACTTECASFYQGILYAPVFVVAAVQCLRIRSRSPQLSAQLLFHLFIALFTLIRTIIDQLFAFGVVQYGSGIYFILWALPGLLFFSTYSLLVHEWARVLQEGYKHSDRSDTCCNRRVVIIVANIVTYLGQAGVFIMLGYLAVVAFISCSAFLVYGYRVYRMFAHRHWKSKVQRRIASDIFIVTIFCTVCFLVRGVTNVVWTKTVDHLGSCSTVAFYISFYFVVEVTPSLAVLYVVRHMPKRHHSSDAMLPPHLQISRDPSSRGSTDHANVIVIEDSTHFLPPLTESSPRHHHDGRGAAAGDGATAADGLPQHRWHDNAGEASYDYHHMSPPDGSSHAARHTHAQPYAHHHDTRPRGAVSPAYGRGGDEPQGYHDHHYPPQHGGAHHHHHQSHHLTYSYGDGGAGASGLMLGSPLRDPTFADPSTHRVDWYEQQATSPGFDDPQHRDTAAGYHPPPQHYNEY